MKVKIIISGNNNEIEITNEVTWSDVLITAAQKDIKIPSPCIARLGETRAILDEESILPKLTSKEGNAVDVIHVFITPVESKGGAELGYREVKAKIKLVYKTDDGAKAHFGNYSRASKANLIRLWNEWLEGDTEEIEDDSDGIVEEISINLCSLSRKELKALIKKEGLKIKGKKGMDDEELIDAIVEARSFNKSSAEIIIDTVEEEISLVEKPFNLMEAINEVARLSALIKEEMATVTLFSNINK